MYNFSERYEIEGIFGDIHKYNKIHCPWAIFFIPIFCILPNILQFICIHECVCVYVKSKLQKYLP